MIKFGGCAYCLNRGRIAKNADGWCEAENGSIWLCGKEQME
jgi:hypothetical protein